MSKRLDKLTAFFRDEEAFMKIKKPAEILELPFTSLKVVDPEWDEFLADADVKTIKDVAELKEDLEIEGLDPAELRKATMVAEMIYYQITRLMEKGDQKRKIILVGLDNAGKTTAVTALSEKYSAIRQLLPTRGLARQSISIFGYEISAFDMGGQKDYREGYFSKAEMYFTATDLIIFCLDIQDSTRYQEALDYYKKILDTLEELKFYPPILIVFTKTDPDMAADVALNKNRIDLIERIEKINPNFDVGYANSSIYDRNSIESVFSMALKRISLSNRVIDEFLKHFLEDIEAQAAAVLSSTGLIFGSYGKTKKEEDLLTNTAAYLQNLYYFHVGEGMPREDYYMMQYPHSRQNFIAEFIIETESGMVYLWILTDDVRKEAENITKFKQELLPLIENFM
jgi:small GTP-binding protein